MAGRCFHFPAGALAYRWVRRCGEAERKSDMSELHLMAKTARLAPVPFGNAQTAVGKLTPGCRIVGLTKGQFSLLDLIAAVLAQTGPAAVTVSTWTPGAREMDAVAALLDGGLVSEFRLLLDRSFVTRHPEYVAGIHAALGPESIRQTRTHAKFALIAAEEWRITIRTSMNFNRNPRFEQFDLDDDPSIYAFFEAAVTELYETMAAGLDVPSPEVVRHFAGATMGELFRGLDADEAKPDPLKAMLAQLSGSYGGLRG